MVIDVSRTTDTAPARTKPPTGATDPAVRRLAAAIATLAPARRASGALWLAAPQGHTRRIAHPRGRCLAVADAPTLVVPESDDPHTVAAWATAVWSSTPGERRELGSCVSWVDLERSGANTIARGARLLWGRRLTADARVPVDVIEHAVELLAADRLTPGVLDGTVVSVTRATAHLA
jgi:hypothetical protein